MSNRPIIDQKVWNRESGEELQIVKPTGTGVLMGDAMRIRNIEVSWEEFERDWTTTQPTDDGLVSLTDLSEEAETEEEEAPATGGEEEVPVVNHEDAIAGKMGEEDGA